SESKIGLFAAMAIGIGGMIGAGIFSILGVVAKASGTAMWLSFIIGGLVALLSNLLVREARRPLSLDRRRHRVSRKGLWRRCLQRGHQLVLVDRVRDRAGALRSGVHMLRADVSAAALTFMDFESDQCRNRFGVHRC